MPADPTAARLALGLRERAVWAMARQGRLPVVRCGRRLVFRLDMLHEWLREQAQAGRQQATAIAGTET